MLNTCTRTYKAEGKGINTVEVKVYYSLGGMNYFTYKNEPRGYYFSITPILVENGWRSYNVFSGQKTCVLECARQSRKRYEEAKSLLDSLEERYLDDFCAENGIVLFGDYIEREQERKVS